ncbi:unnamed protein product, partial [Cyprideis torosa]
MSLLPCARGSDFLKMNSEVEKESSGFEISRQDDGFASPKFDGMEILTGHQGFPESGKTTPLKDIVPGYTDNDNQTCGASDQIEGHLRRHEFTHKKEKRLNCSVCGDGFRSKSGLHNHEKKHSEGNQSACALCDPPFGLVEDLEEHLKWHIQG